MERHAALGISHNAPPSSSSTFLGSSDQSLAKRLKPNLGGRTAFQRERELASRYGAFDGAVTKPRKSEWDVLKENHRFIRDDEAPGSVSWEERLARAYESQLFKEFALVDLKHYKSKQFALRWRTAVEVVEGVGEDSCAGLRCKWHRPAASGASGVSDARSGDEEGGGAADEERRRRRRKTRTMPPLRAFELPFRYSEAGETKEALVKVRLCPKCVGKLLWKPSAEREDSNANERGKAEERGEGREERGEGRRTRSDRGHEPNQDGKEARPRDLQHVGEEHESERRRRDRSSERYRVDHRRRRSRSPRRRNEI